MKNLILCIFLSFTNAAFGLLPSDFGAFDEALIRTLVQPSYNTYISWKRSNYSTMSTEAFKNEMKKKFTLAISRLMRSRDGLEYLASQVASKYNVQVNDVLKNIDSKYASRVAMELSESKSRVLGFLGSAGAGAEISAYIEVNFGWGGSKKLTLENIYRLTYEGKDSLGEEVGKELAEKIDSFPAPSSLNSMYEDLGAELLEEQNGDLTRAVAYEVADNYDKAKIWISKSYDNLLIIARRAIGGIKN